MRSWFGLGEENLTQRRARPIKQGITDGGTENGGGKALRTAAFLPASERTENGREERCERLLFPARLCCLRYLLFKPSFFTCPPWLSAACWFVRRRIRHWTRAAFCRRFLSVPIAPRNPGEITPKPADMPFEEALNRLESIVSTMEAEDLPLEKLLASYQEGAGLAKLCQGRLSEAELKIQQLEKTASGDYKLNPPPLGKQEAE